ncbi:MAG: glycosyl hydrolase family 28-related protein [Rikenellaceae bacterium]
MRIYKITLLLAMLITTSFTYGAYKESMKRTYKTSSVKDYGMHSDSVRDQSAQLQTAINSVSKSGGGKLVIPKGVYCFSSVKMASNVHLLVDKDAILKPYWGKARKVIMLNFSTQNEKVEGYIENCSIRCLQEGETYTVDYSDKNPFEKWGVRFIRNGQVKNFLVADANIKDNYTTYCGIIFSPSSNKSSTSWEIARPTDGTIINCSIDKASAGYGLCQLHGAERIHFEDIYAYGGITLRLESGAGGPCLGVYDITGANIKNECGACAVLMAPHCANNGTVTLKGVYSKSSAWCVSVGSGFIDKKNIDNPNAKLGRFADDSVISDIHAVYGEEAQVGTNSLDYYNKDQYSLLYENCVCDDSKTVVGPSIAAINNSASGSYNVTFKNISSEGFTYNKDKILKSTKSVNGKKNWALLKSIPVQKGKYTEENLRLKSEAKVKSF